MATPARAVKSTAGVEGEAAAAISQNLPPPPTERKVVSLLLLLVLLFKWVDDVNMGWNVGERGGVVWNYLNALSLRPSIFFFLLLFHHLVVLRGFDWLFFLVTQTPRKRGSFCFCLSLFLCLCVKRQRVGAKVWDTGMEDYGRKNIIQEASIYNHNMSRCGFIGMLAANLVS